MAGSLPICDVSTVLRLKQDLQRLLWIPRFQQRLLHQGAILNDEEHLKVALGFENAARFFDVQLVVLPCAPSSSSADARMFVELAGSWSCRNMEYMRSMLQQGHDPNQPADIGGERLTALQVAARQGQVLIVHMLLEAGALCRYQNLSWADSEFEHFCLAVLREASRGHDMEVLRLLLEALGHGYQDEAVVEASQHGRVHTVALAFGRQPGFASSINPGPSTKLGGRIF